MRFSIRYLFIIILLCAGINYPQGRTNLDVFYGLIDSSLSLLPDDLPEGKKVFIESSGMPLLYNYIFRSLDSRYKGINAADSAFSLSYAVEEIKMEYGELFRKSFLGDYYVRRNFHLEGNFVLPYSGESRTFSYAYADTAALDSIRQFENSIYPFSGGALPPEPFLSGLLEPVVAIGTAVTAVILFFVIRSE